jgi:hypothetical protein
MSVVYRALVKPESARASPGKRIEALEWRDAESVARDSGLAFDHSDLVRTALETTRDEVDRLELPFETLPAQFTLGELQTACEHLLGRRLDKSSFRRRLADRGVVEAVEGKLRLGAFRPAQLYRRVRR